MKYRRMARVKTSKYKYVKLSKRRLSKNTKRWEAYFYQDGQAFSKMFDTEREAAIAVDTHLIKIGKEPVNILKPLKK